MLSQESLLPQVPNLRPSGLHTASISVIQKELLFPSLLALTKAASHDLVIRRPISPLLPPSK